MIIEETIMDVNNAEQCTCIVNREDESIIWPNYLHTVINYNLDMVTMVRKLNPENKYILIKIRISYNLKEIDFLDALLNFNLLAYSYIFNDEQIGEYFYDGNITLGEILIDSNQETELERINKKIKNK